MKKHIFLTGLLCAFCLTLSCSQEEVGKDEAVFVPQTWKVKTTFGVNESEDADITKSTDPTKYVLEKIYLMRNENYFLLLDLDKDSELTFTTMPNNGLQISCASGTLEVFLNDKLYFASHNNNEGLSLLELDPEIMTTPGGATVYDTFRGVDNKDPEHVYKSAAFSIGFTNGKLGISENKDVKLEEDKLAITVHRATAQFFVVMEFYDLEGPEGNKIPTNVKNWDSYFGYGDGNDLLRQFRIRPYIKNYPTSYELLSQGEGDFVGKLGTETKGIVVLTEVGIQPEPIECDIPYIPYNGEASSYIGKLYRSDENILGPEGPPQWLFNGSLNGCTLSVYIFVPGSDTHHYVAEVPLNGVALNTKFRTILHVFVYLGEMKRHNISVETKAVPPLGQPEIKKLTNVFVTSKSY